MRVAFLPASEDGCAFFRMWLPYLRTPNSKYIMPDEKGLVSYKSFSDCELGVVQRLASDKNYETLMAMKQIGIKICFDLDDDMWSVQASNPAKNHLKVMKDFERGFMTCASTCDIVTCSTTRLKSVVEQKIGTRIPIVAIPNAIDPALLKQSILPKNKDRVVIGWAGSDTHLKDLEQMGHNTLANVVQNVPKVHLHWIGMVPPGESLLHHNRVLVHSWVPVKEYFARLSTWNWDIGVAPLENNRFNRSKSALKMVEMGAIRTPCLASPVQPYLEFTSLDNDLKWLLCETEKDWKTKLFELSTNEDQRLYYGNKMYNVVMENYNMKKRIVAWHEAFKTALG
jgi:glycosyltransferase involved in cell wall biosynthesis